MALIFDHPPFGTSSEFDDLLHAARAEEAWAFRALFARYASPVAGFLRARGGDDPDGLANEVLLKAFRGIGSFEGTEGGFRSWIFTIARNALLDEHRRAGRRPAAVATAPGDLPEPVVSGDEVTAPLVHDERVGQILEGLPDAHREVLLLRIVAGLSVEETAEVMGKSVGAVKTLQHRVLRKLRAKLEVPGGAEPGRQHPTRRTAQGEV